MTQPQNHSMASFVAQRRHRIDLGRPARGDETCDERNGKQDHACQNERRGVEGPDLEELAPEKAHQEESSKSSQRDPDQRQSDSLPSTRAQTCLLSAPSAMRMPISWVRCATLKLMTP